MLALLGNLNIGTRVLVANALAVVSALAVGLIIGSGIRTWVLFAVVLAAIATVALAFRLRLSITRQLEALGDQSERVAIAVVEGRLAVRCDSSAAGAEFQSLLENINRTLDALVAPARLTARYVERIARGDVPPKIAGDYPGEFGSAKNDLNRCIEVVHALVSDVETLSAAAAEGRLDARIDGARHPGEFRKLVEAANATMAGLARLTLQVHSGETATEQAARTAKKQNDYRLAQTRRITDAIGRLAHGSVDLALTIEKGDEDTSGDKESFDVVADAVHRVAQAIGRLHQDVQRLAVAAVEGQLTTRADPSRHEGDFRRVVEDLNAALDAVTGPLGVVATYVDRISRGEIPSPITDRYRGDFDSIKGALNRCIGAVNALVADANALAHAAVEGRLDVRAEAERHSGEFRKIIEGVNATLDAVIIPLSVAAQCVERISRGDIPAPISDIYRGEFDQLRENLNQCIGAVKALVGDANMLANAAVSGKLDARADPSKHRGDFCKIIEGVNRALDSTIAPVGEAAEVLEKLAQRDLTACVQGDYQGDHARIKDSLNATAAALDEALAQVAEAVHQVSSAAGRIAASSQAVASGASQQASAIEETSASLESMASMTEHSADSAQSANLLARGAKGAAVDGTTAMEQMRAAMGKIRASAEGTSQIIKDINEIAFQTNLLALNAAVEAARAGEAGRGFAVVAEEVRSLALRSKEAATKTEGLIRQSVRQTEEGEVASRDVDEKLSQISTAVGKVSELVAEIAAASKEQAVGIAQVTRAVSQMDAVTQQNAATSEESSSAAAELSSQADILAAMVGSFRIQRGDSEKPSGIKRSKRNGAHAAAETGPNAMPIR